MYRPMELFARKSARSTPWELPSNNQDARVQQARIKCTAFLFSAGPYQSGRIRNHFLAVSFDRIPSFHVVTSCSNLPVLLGTPLRRRGKSLSSLDSSGIKVVIGCRRIHGCDGSQQQLAKKNLSALSAYLDARLHLRR